MYNVVTSRLPADTVCSVSLSVDYSYIGNFLLSLVHEVRQLRSMFCFVFVSRHVFALQIYWSLSSVTTDGLDFWRWVIAKTTTTTKIPRKQMGNMRNATEQIVWRQRHDKKQRKHICAYDHRRTVSFLSVEDFSYVRTFQVDRQDIYLYLLTTVNLGLRVAHVNVLLHSADLCVRSLCTFLPLQQTQTARTNTAR